jgi:hypothetical protein
MAVEDLEVSDAARLSVRRVMLVATIAFSIALGSPARAADCSPNVSACIDANKNKPNAVAKCQAAGQRCAKTGIYVGPFSGVSYEVHKCLRFGCD